MMTHVLKKSLLALAVAVFALSQSSSVHAQDVPTSADVGLVNAILDLDSGEVTLQIGAGLQVFGLSGIPFDNAAAVDGLLAIDPAPVFPPGATQGPGTQNDAAGIGVLNTGFLPTGEFNLGAILLPDFRTAESLADFNLNFDGPGSPDRAALSVSAPNNVFQVGGGVTPPPVIPEPGSLSLLALAGLGAVARRRR